MLANGWHVSWLDLSCRMYSKFIHIVLDVKCVVLHKKKHNIKINNKNQLLSQFPR